MAPLADFLLSVLPTDVLPYHLTHYVQGKTPFSTLPVVSATLASYLAVIFGIQEVMRARPAQKLNTLFRIHNAFLSLGSALLLALMIEEVASIWVKSGTYNTMCNEDVMDTEEASRFSACFPPLRNGFVMLHSTKRQNERLMGCHLFESLGPRHHIITTMRQAGGAKIWWKKYLTSMQITQFVIDLFIVYFGTYQHFAHSRFEFLPHVANCAGTETAALLGCGLLSSYLVLFINFYIQTYQKPAKGRKSVANGNGHVHATGLKQE
ncbi:GNS1/SUR4 membrane protein [Chiua virens]|nr:GNS1/SUR4 membrane protein [Chiua virens]